MLQRKNYFFIVSFFLIFFRIVSFNFNFKRDTFETHRLLSTRNSNNNYNNNMEFKNDQQPLVEVVSTIGCKYCKKVKHTFASLRINYRNIDLNDEKTILNDRDEERVKYARSNKIPQVYVNDVWLGGCDKVMEGIDNRSLFNLLDSYSVSYDENAGPLEEETTPIDMSNLIHQPSLEDGLNTITFETELETNEELKNIYNKRNNIIHHPLMIAKELQIMALELVEKYGNTDGSRMDYTKMKASIELKKYIIISSFLKELEVTSLQLLSISQKFAFFSNLYNALIVHATCILGGCEDSPSARTAFFSGSSGAIYIIAGLKMSPDQIEHGILRCNRRHPGQPITTSSYLPSGDAIEQLSLPLDSFDPRLHFILNCGASSCPPIRVLSGEAEQLNEALRLAAKAYLELQVSVSIETVTSSESHSSSNYDFPVVYLPRLLLWYGFDFGTNVSGQVAAALNCLNSEHKRTLIERIRSCLPSSSSSSLSSSVDTTVTTDSLNEFTVVSDASGDQIPETHEDTAGIVAGDAMNQGPRVLLVRYLDYNWAVNEAPTSQ